MKQILVLLSAIILYSCSSSESDNNASLLGKWNYTLIGFTNSNGEITYLPPGKHENCDDNAITFNADGSVIYDFYPSEDCILEQYTDSYVKNGNSLEITFTYGMEQYEILKLTNTDLQFKNINGNNIVCYKRAN